MTLGYFRRSVPLYCVVTVGSILLTVATHMILKVPHKMQALFLLVIPSG